MAQYIAVANIMPIRFAFRHSIRRVPAAGCGSLCRRRQPSGHAAEEKSEPCHIHFTVGFVWIDVRVGRLTKSESTLLCGNRRIVYCNCERFALAPVKNGASPGYGS